MDNKEVAISIWFPLDTSVSVALTAAGQVPLYDLVVAKAAVQRVYGELERKYRRARRLEMAIGLASTGKEPHERLPVLVLCVIWEWLNATGTGVGVEDDTAFVVDKEIKMVRHFV